ncbi:methylamine utilization protein MauE [Dactylosporangium maewongense]|uniref:Methylamine utilization protein MauE n=1 Tax=Dactylosporangium maewongense TaxID=634393 RepID=A0ABP4NS00_9ACTN
MHYLAITVRCAIGLVFLASSVGKLWGRGAFPAFVASLRGVGLLPRRLVRPAAIVLVVAEGVLCAALAVPTGLVPGLALVGAALLLGVFTVGVAVAVRRGTASTCRCFGASTERLGRRHVGRNILLTGLATGGAAAAFAAAASPPGSLRPAGLLLAGFAGLLLGFLATRFDDLAAVFRGVEHDPRLTTTFRSNR